MIVCLSPNGPMAYRGCKISGLLVATIDGVVELSPQPDGEWPVTGRHLGGHHVSALLREPEHGDIYASTHGKGIFRSRDDGRSWDQCVNGLSKTNIFSLAAVLRGGRSEILAGSEPVSLFVSSDRGESWEERPSVGGVPGRDQWTFPVPPHEAHLKSIALDPRDPDIFYACVEQGALLRTQDGGLTWDELSAYYKDSDKWYRDIHKVVPLDGNPDCLLMSTGMGFYRSEDGGLSWTQLTNLDFDIRYPDHLVVLPDAAGTIMLSGAGQSPDQWRHTKAAGATVRSSGDGGRSWSDASAGLVNERRPAIEAMSIATEGGEYILFLGDTDGDIYVRGNGDEAWRRVARAVGPVSKVGHYRHVQPPIGKPAA